MRVDDVASQLKKWNGLGMKVFPSGTIYFGPIRGEPGKNGWLHQIFRPLDEGILNEFSKENNFHSQYDYSRQLYQCNGAILFLKTFFLFGLRIDPNMSSTDLPWDLVMTNLGKREIGGQFGGIVIGGARFNGSYIDYIETKENEIIAFDANTNSVAFKWPNFEVFLRSEINRLNEEFNEDGTPPEDFQLTPNSTSY